MAKQFVAYAQLGNYKPGDVVNPADWSEEEWAYMVEHEVVVPKNSPNDPNVLKENESRVISGMAGEGVQRNVESVKEVKRQEALEAHRKASGDKSEETTAPANEAERDKMGAEAHKAAVEGSGGQETSKTDSSKTESTNPQQNKPAAPKPTVAPKKE